MPTTRNPLIRNWTPEALPDLTGKSFIITGGNSGIGLEAAKRLAARNADVVLACRDAVRGQEALADIAERGEGACDLLVMDLADMASIRAAADEAKKRFSTLSALINNAGVMQTPKLKTVDGLEMQLGTNHLGHVLWTALMIDHVDPAEGRVVTVASIVHKFGHIDFDNLMMERGYDPTRSYARSKLANLLYAQELHRRLQAAGSSIKSIACHPGYSNTSLQFKGPTGLFKLMYAFSNALIAQPASLGAWPTLLAASDERAVSGGYYGPTGPFDARGPVGDAIIEKRARDEAVAKRLWDMSEKLVGETLSV
ncbi:MAG: SDR family NAD(P)-dependent oxidoreductase [Erythrobacter sp.]|nr:SDR family NAD(P)-dependent oxidoreductase [Erythrobacter sp.]